MEAEQLLKKLRDNFSIEDIQYLYVLEKIRKGLTFADTEKTLLKKAEKQSGKWFIK